MTNFQTTSDLDTIRENFGIGDHISDEVMHAFAIARNWFDLANVEWSELEDSFCGVFGALGEDEAIGDYLFDRATECGDLENVPRWIRHHIDWESVGRDARFGGELKAERVRDGSYDWAVFRNW